MKILIGKNIVTVLAVCCANLVAGQVTTARIRINTGVTYQTIDHFGASDAWACQFVGNWPETKRNQIADWLFSVDTLPDGSPRGIGLSLWRYNLGAGSAEQGDSSGIRDRWRRAALTTNGGDRVAGQNWFLKAAKERGVQQFLAFYNSPPVQFTKNGKAFANRGRCNIDSSRMDAFAAYTVDAIGQIMRSTGVRFNYLSPVNEPQWDWSDGGQEGCPYTNQEISTLVRIMSKGMQQHRLKTKLVVAEAGDLHYLLADGNKPGKGNQIHDFFNPRSTDYIGNLRNVLRTVSAHSYFTTSPFQRAVALREQVRDSMAAYKGLGFWQSEYCILGNNNGEIRGSGKDTGMKAALYLARVVYADLAVANARSWQWWTAVSAYNYKDGLVYVDKKEQDGNYSDSKMLWALGNYSYFIRPGMKRVEVLFDTEELCVTAFKGKGSRVVMVVVNNSGEPVQPLLELDARPLPVAKDLQVFITDNSRKLQKTNVYAGDLVIPATAVATIVID